MYSISRLTESFGSIVSLPGSYNIPDTLYGDLMRDKFLVLRGVPGLTLEQFTDLIQKIQPSAELNPHLLMHNKERPGNENAWHADLTWMSNPPSFIAIQLIEKPNRGGDTVFCDTNLCYESLSQTVKDAIANRSAIHDQNLFASQHADYKKLVSPDLIPKSIEYSRSLHPIVTKHDVTGNPHLNVNGTYTLEIPDIENSQQLLNFLYNTYTIPEFQYRHQWQLNDIVIWDNRAIIHYALSDYWPNSRVLNRVIGFEDRPVLPFSNTSPVDNSGRFQGYIQRAKNRRNYWFLK